jgi:hypothetical protein
MSKGPVASRYEKMAVDREPILNRARECAELTLPSLFPPSGHSQSARLPTPWSSMGARCVDNLAAKLLLTLFPPNTPFFSLKIDDFTLEAMSQRKGARAAVEKTLNKIERAVMTALEGAGARPSLFEGLKQLEVGGNVLFHITPDNKVKTHKLSNYVVKRDPMGNLLELTVKECISPLELPESVRVLVNRVEKKEGEAPDSEDDVDLYTAVRFNGTDYDVWQECEGVEVGKRGSYPRDKLPWLAARWTVIDGEDYGRGRVEEYLGDFKSLEGLQRAIVEGSAAASRVVLLLNPNSTTKPEDINNAENGAIVRGRIEDIAALQMDKFADFRVAQATAQELKTSLSYAFMLTSAIQRDGERVTAEEIKRLANELEAGLGGVYSAQSQGLQLPLVTSVMNNLTQQKKLPPLPKGAVHPTITTGIEAIGRGNDLNRLSSFIASLEPLGPGALAWINMPDLISRTAVGHQIDADGLVKTVEEYQAEQQQSMVANAAQAAAPNIVNAVSNMATAQPQ